MQKLTSATSVSLLSLAAALALPGTADAACVPAVTSALGVTCIGTGALANNTADYASAFGRDALLSNTTGYENLAAGDWALKSNTTGSSNTAVGSTALQLNTIGNSNTGIGHYALRNGQGSNNTGVGDYVLYESNGSGNTAAGVQALRLNLTGNNNIALGYQAGYNLTTGSNNITIGNLGNTSEDATIRIGTQGTQTRAFVAGIRGVPLSGGEVVVVKADGQLGVAPALPGTGNQGSGASALENNTTGNYNSANGASALVANTTGSNNTAVGYGAGANLTTGSNNIAIANGGAAGESGAIRIGVQGTQTRAFVAGISGVTLSGGQTVVVKPDGQLGVAPEVPGTSNVAVGGSALISNTTGNYNTAAGAGALSFNTSGANNTASGASVLAANTTGSNNTASGTNALFANTTGSANSASGVDAMRTNTTGSYNVSNGNGALKSNTVGSKNVAVGFEAARKQTTGSNNTAIGFRAGLNWTTGSFNVAIANAGVAADTKTIRIGAQGVQKRAFLAGVRGVNITGGQVVVVKSDGQLGVISSSRRYKQDIQPMGEASDPLLKLRPVTFHYKQAEADGSRPLQYGLIAEEVAATMPELAIYNAEGQPESVAYQLLPSLLLNEYQKQARELEAAREQIGSLEAEMAAMKLTLARLASAQSGKTQLASAP